MSEPNVSSETDEDGSAPVSELKLSDALAILREIGRLANVSADRRGFDWSPRGVFNGLRRVIRDNLALRLENERLHRDVTAAKQNAGEMRDVVRNAMELFITEVEKLGVPKERIEPLLADVRASMLPPEPPEEPSVEVTAADLDEGEERTTREYFISPESATGVREVT